MLNPMIDNISLMETLTFKTAPSIGIRVRRFPVLHFPALPQSYRKPLPKSTKLVVFRASCGADSATFGGWDELTPADDSINSGESAQLRKFLASIGFDDKKYVLVFILGLISALAITRVRVSSIIVFPATVLVFGIGFSLGVVRGGSGTSSNGYSIVKAEKLKALVEFFDGLDDRVNHLKNELQNSIGFNRVALSDLKNYVKEIELIHSSALSARDAFVSPATAGSSNGVLTDSIKSNKRKKEIGGMGFRLLGFLFGESLVDVSRKKSEETKDSARGSVSSNVGEEKIFSSSPSSRFDTVDPIPYHHGNTKLRSNPKVGSMDSDEVIGGDGGYTDREEFSYQNNRFQFVNNQRVYMKSSRSYDASRSSFLDHQLDFGGAMKNEASVFEEQVLEKSSGTYSSWQRNEEGVNNTNRYKSRHREKNLLENQNLELKGEENTSSSISDDVIFDRYLTEANNLLKQAEEIVKGRYDEERSQAILYKTAEVLSRAVAMKPMSLLAVGKLGNTYLLHGELKLRISRDLRSLLSSNEPFSFDRKIGFLSSLDSNPPSKDKVAAALMGVCEECEELLVKAGRNYRLALSIDGSDVRALYNWGLALSFRAQLIADIGPEAAFDADKVFLAAIDKFVAMMSKGNVYAPDALYRWGMTLQQRSYLRPRNSKEKVKLLEQARRLYEDSLDMESDNPRVKQALSSCLSELDYRHF